MRVLIRSWILLLAGLATSGLLAEPTFRNITIDHVANMGFADETADDGIGGWTDQGPTNDLHDFPTGNQKFLGIPFRIVPPSRNQDRSVIALQGRDRPSFPKEAKIDADGVKATQLYFLHTCAWGGTSKSRSVAEYVIEYEDGSTALIPLRVGVEFTNWWGIKKGESCEVAWANEVQGVRRGVNLFTWNNPRPDLRIRSITFRSLSKMPVPILLAVTATDEKIEAESVPEPVATVGGADWMEMTAVSPNQIAGVFDVREVMGKPAAKERVRYWGTALGEDVLKLTPEQIKSLAERLSALGFNWVRFTPARTIQTDEAEIWQKCILSEGEISALGRFCAGLGENGISTTFDLSQLAFEFKGSPKDPNGQEITLDAWKALYETTQEGILSSKAGDASYIKASNFVTGIADDRARSDKSVLSFDPLPVVMKPQSGFPYVLALKREFGKPYCGILSSAFPNPYIAERPLMISAMASLQGWDACSWMESAWSMGDKPQLGELAFSPMVMAQIPAAALAFRRGDLQQAKSEWICQPGTDCGLRALVHRSGFKTGSRAVNVTTSGKVDEKLRKVISDTEQITWTGNVGVFQVNASRFQALIGFIANRKFKGTVWDVDTPAEFASISVISLSKESIRSSKHFLITGTTRSVDQGMKFNSEHNKCFDMGSGSLKMEPLKASIVMHRLRPETSLKVRALGIDGKPMKDKVKTRWVNNDLLLSWVPGAVYLEVFKP